jgi:hypothetical protein
MHQFFYSVMLQGLCIVQSRTLLNSKDHRNGTLLNFISRKEWFLVGVSQ